MTLSPLSPSPSLRGRGRNNKKRGFAPLKHPVKGGGIKLRKTIYNKLKEAARQKQLITYKELATVVGLDWSKDYGRCRQIFPILRAICTAEVEQGHPMLSAIVVRQDTRMPGAGFFALARKLGCYQGGTDYTFWLAEREAVIKGVR